MRSILHEMYKDLQASSITFCHKAAMYSSLFAYYLLKIDLTLMFLFIFQIILTINSSTKSF